MSKGKPKKSFLWRQQDRRERAGGNSSFRWYTFTEILSAAGAALMATTVGLGYVTFKTAGLPIGGMLSKALTSIYLCPQEDKLFHAFSSLRKLNLNLLSMRREQIFCLHRYVDDIILVSRIL